MGVYGWKDDHGVLKDQRELMALASIGSCLLSQIDILEKLVSLLIGSY